VLIIISDFLPIGKYLQRFYQKQKKRRKYANNYGIIEQGYQKTPLWPGKPLHTLNRIRKQAYTTEKPQTNLPVTKTIINKHHKQVAYAYNTGIRRVL
jgi:hypothetical protein